MNTENMADTGILALGACCAATALRADKNRDVGSLLVIDDNEMNRDMLSRRLDRHGYDVAVAAGGAEAIDCLEQSSFDAILLDIMMPMVSGWEVLKWIRERHSPSQLPVIMATARDSSEEIVQALEMGANDYITKPFDFQVVLARVNTHVRLKQISESLIITNQKLEKLAMRDALTGALNRHSFNEMFEHEWHQSKRNQRPLSCIIFDIDFFKRINDSYGHAAGDRVLKLVAETLCAKSRETNLVSRFGGEEFCILLPDTAEEGALAWCEGARQRIAELVIPVDGHEVSITGSFGLSTHSSDLPLPQKMIEQADEAMFIAKRLGRNRVVSFNRHKIPVGKDQPQIWDGLIVTNLMSPLEISLSPEQTIGEAAQLFESEQVDSIAVLNADGRLAGLIQEDDIMTAMLASSLSDCPVRDVMKTQFVSYPTETSVREVGEFLCRDTVRQVFIVNGTQPLGIVRRADFMRWIAQSKDANQEQTECPTR